VLAVPSGFDSALRTATSGPSTNRELFFSVGIAVIMLVLYVTSMVFSFSNQQPNLAKGVEKAKREVGRPRPELRNALIVLILATAGIALMSEILVNSVEPVINQLHLSEFFVGIILIPLIGNVAEHVVAMEVAYKNRMDLSIGISLGSSLQIALFVTPLLVFIGLLFNQRLLLVFNTYELIALAIASVVAALVSNDGESNWLEGVQLCSVYLMLAMAFFLVPSA